MNRKELAVGDRASLVHVFTEMDVRRFAELSKDTNPIHLDESAAQKSLFGQRVVHGMLVASLFSGLLGIELPGPGTIYLGQSLSFKAPVYFGDRVTATVEVTEIREEKAIAKLRTFCTNQDGATVIDGEAVVKYS
jgi:acyl dehydratase